MKKSLGSQHFHIFLHYAFKFILVVVETEVLVSQIGSEVEESSNEMSQRHFSDGEIFLKIKQSPFPSFFNNSISFPLIFLNYFSHYLSSQYSIDSLIADIKQGIFHQSQIIVAQRKYDFAFLAAAIMKII